MVKIIKNNNTISKQGLLQILYEHFNSSLTQDDLNDAINIILKYLTDSLVHNLRIEIRGFGSFSLRQRKKINAEIMYNVIYFRMSKQLQHEINTAKY